MVLLPTLAPTAVNDAHKNHLKMGAGEGRRGVWKLRDSLSFCRHPHSRNQQSILRKKKMKKTHKEKKNLKVPRTRIGKKPTNTRRPNERKAFFKNPSKKKKHISPSCLKLLALTPDPWKLFCQCYFACLIINYSSALGFFLGPGSLRRDRGGGESAERFVSRRQGFFWEESCVPPQASISPHLTVWRRRGVLREGNSSTFLLKKKNQNKRQKALFSASSPPRRGR